MNPALLAALAQHGGPPGPSGPPGAAPGMPMPPPPGAASGGGGNVQAAMQYLRQAIQALRQYESAEPDPEDKAVAAKVAGLLMQLIAKDQKQKDAALGSTPAHVAMRNAAGGPQ